MPRFEYEMKYPEIRTIKANTIKDLTKTSGYSHNIIYSKLSNSGAYKTNIISVRRVELPKPEKIRTTAIRTRQKNKKYNYELKFNDEVYKCTKICEGAKILNIEQPYMLKILNNEDLCKQYNITLIV